MQVFYTPIVHQRRDKKKTHKCNVNHHTHTGWTLNDVKKIVIFLTSLTVQQVHVLTHTI